MSGVCETGTEEVQLKAAGICSQPSENVGVPVSAKRCLQYTGFSVKMCVVAGVCAWALWPLCAAWALGMGLSAAAC